MALINLLAQASGLQLTATSLVVLYVFWRLWTFTIRPLLRTNEPKQVPYILPFLGHAISFFQDSNRACQEARKSMGGTDEPLGMVIAGEQFYIIQSPQDVTNFYANKKTLSFDEYVQDVLIGMGCSPDGVKKMSFPQEHLKKSIIHAGEDYYRAQFLPGPRYNEFWPEVYRRIEAKLSHEALDKSSKPYSLWNLCKSALLGPTLAAIFGDAVLTTDPSIIETMTAFDASSWKVNYKIPRPFSNDVHAAREKMIKFFMTYQALPATKKGDASWFSQSLDREMRRAGLSDHDIAVFNFSVSWTALGNAFKGCFWLLTHILYDVELFAQVLQEVRSAHPDNLHGSEAVLESSYPILLSVYNETLRYDGSSISVRTAIAPTALGRYSIPAGSRIMLPTRQLHINQNSFVNAQQFHKDRFNDPKLAKSSGFRPFGGGVSYCPGRYLARRELIAFVVLLLTTYDVKLSPESEAHFPLRDEVKPAVGILEPLPGEDVLLLLEPKQSRT